MSLLDDLQPPDRPPIELDLTDARVTALLADLPGNILKGHGRTFTRMRFVRFTDPVMGRKWAGEVGQNLTTATALDAQSRGYKSTPSVDGGVFIGLYLTHAGLEKLGCSSASPAHPAFREGLLGRQTYSVRGGRGEEHLRDTAADWATDGYAQELHALLVVGFDAESRGEGERRFAEWLAKPGIELIDAGGRSTPEESGGRLFDAGGKAGRREVEHFGYRDGIAQLRFFPKSRPSQPEELSPLRQVLFELPAGARPAGSPPNFASFLVFRKIEQHVSEFQKGAQVVASKLMGDPSPTRLERAYAWIMGRFRDGSPLAKYDQPAADPANDFTYAGDAGPNGGRRCPFHAHVRKMNPRGDFNPIDQPINPSARLPVRRSVPFGERELLDGDQRVLAVDRPPPPGARVGLLFMAFVSSIEDQFEHIVTAWANQSGFPWASAQIDPLIGRTKIGNVSVPGPPGTGSTQFPRAVTTRGGAYLIALPRSFFAAMAAGRLP